MAYLYEVQTSDGQYYDVTVKEHHEDHPNDAFKKHLLDVIKQSGAQIAAGIIVHRFTHKGGR